jgi:hypothetical protein
MVHAALAGHAPPVGWGKHGRRLGQTATQGRSDRAIPDTDPDQIPRHGIDKLFHETATAQGSSAQKSFAHPPPSDHPHPDFHAAPRLLRRMFSHGCQEPAEEYPIVRPQRGSTLRPKVKIYQFATDAAHRRATRSPERHSTITRFCERAAFSRLSDGLRD